jgi:hypothetical protein
LLNFIKFNLLSPFFLHNQSSIKILFIFSHATYFKENTKNYTSNYHILLFSLEYIHSWYYFWQGFRIPFLTLTLRIQNKHNFSSAQLFQWLSIPFDYSFYIILINMNMTCLVIFVGYNSLKKLTEKQYIYYQMPNLFHLSLLKQVLFQNNNSNSQEKTEV